MESSLINIMRSVIFAFRRLACCIGRKRPSTTEPDVIARVATCGSQDLPQASSPILLQPEQTNSQDRATRAVLSLVESLPFEIQIAILSKLSIESLRALIKSSPRFYQVYFRHRLSVLNNSLKLTLGGIFQDAYAACWSDLWSAGDDAAVVQFSFRDYHNSLPTDPMSSAAGTLPLEIAHKMADFHLRVVEPLTNRYVYWALGALSSSSPQLASVSRTEKARVQRAMYRLQIICNMSIRNNRVMAGILDDFGPWQAEQILCVHEFAKERYESVFVECAWHLDQERNPKYRRIPLWEVDERLLLCKYDREPVPVSFYSFFLCKNLD